MKPITGKELCRRLNEAGWTLKRIKGSHPFLARPANGKSSPFPFTEIRTSNPDWRIELQKTQEFLGEYCSRQKWWRKIVYDLWKKPDGKF